LGHGQIISPGARFHGAFELILANAAHVKNVPGRKTDVNDTMWLAGLMAHGPIRRPSLVPDEPNPADARLAAHPQAVFRQTQRSYAAHSGDPARSK
jgi:hypothetical protein